MKKIKQSSAGLSMSNACLLGAGISVTLLLLLALIMSLLISNEYVDISMSVYLAGIAQFIATLIGCIIVGKLMKEGTVLACIIVAGACIFVQFAAAILFFGGISGRFVPGMLANLAGCGSAILLCISNINRSFRKKRKIRSR